MKLVPVAINVPPVAAANQLIISPVPAVAVNAGIVPPEHINAPFAVGVKGNVQLHVNAGTVKLVVQVVPLLASVTVIVVPVPLAMPVIVLPLIVPAVVAVIVAFVLNVNVSLYVVNAALHT